MTSPLTPVSTLPPEQRAEYEELIATLGKQYGLMPVILAVQFTNISACVAKLAAHKDLPDDQREQAKRIAGGALAMMTTLCNSAMQISDESVMRCIDSIREMDGLITDDLSGLRGGKSIQDVAAQAIRDAANRG